MQININSVIYKPISLQSRYTSNPTIITKPEYDLSKPVMFMGGGVVQKTVTSQIAHEKSKLLRHLKDILELNAPILTEKEKISALIKQAHATINMVMQRDEAIEKEMELLIQNNTLNAQQKMDRAQQLRKEYNRLCKVKLTKPKENQPVKENYDYALINKFKTAIMNDDFDLAKIYKEHYKDLAQIQTVKEFKEKYPSIRVPTSAKEVLIQKILNTLNRKFYLDLDELFEQGDADTLTYCLVRYFDEYFERFSEQFENKTQEDLLNQIGVDVTRKVLAIYEDLKFNENFESIPAQRMHIIAPVTATDKEMLDIDYDKLVIETFKQMILEGKKLNQIEYNDDKTCLKASSIKGQDYSFEKIPEKVKKIILDAQKPLRLQRDYQNFTTEELKSRLNFFTGTEVGNNERIFDTIIDFDGCKFTEEDKQYLIKFLRTLDKVSDEEITMQEAIGTINKNNIRPHGTNKLNEIERKNLEEKIKLEQSKQLELQEMRQEFNDAINKLYSLNLSDIAETFSKYYPENYEEETLKATQKALQIIKNSLEENDTNKIRTKFLRLEIYNDYASSSSELFLEAQNYANRFEEEEKENKIGQYLINRGIIDNYPSNKNMFKKPKVLDRIMERFSHDKDLAAILACKYEDYYYLDKKDRQSILNILKIFDSKDANDKIILKNIIENDYINIDTVLNNPDNSRGVQTTIASRAKKEIFNKYKFPGCVDLFEAFENALTSTATEFGTSGIKKTGSNNNSLEHKMEVKIIGYPDRLFSSKNDYCFDIYSEKGLH